MHQLPGAQGAPYGLVSATLEPARYASLKTVLALIPHSQPDLRRLGGAAPVRQTRTALQAA